ncbi:MAG: phage integrase SAM-like domain-containing protein [Janthinobacterium lividum]
MFNTARTYATAARHLREFAQASRFAVNFDTIMPTFGERFTAYLVGPVGPAHLTDNTISKILTRVKLFMKWAGTPTLIIRS